MTDTVHLINPDSPRSGASSPAPKGPSRVVTAANKALQAKGISSVIEHEDPEHFTTRIFTLFPPLAELHEAGAFPYPNLDALLEAHLEQRFGKDVWDGFSAEKRLKLKKGLAGSARNWDDLIYQVVLENVDAIPGLTPEQRTRLKQAPLIREEFCHNSPLNGQSYYDDNGNLVQLTHAGSCTEDRESENIHLMRRVSYNKTGETLYYTGRPETHTKAVEQATWMFLRELESTGKGITQNADGTYTFNYVVDSLIDSPALASQAPVDVDGSLRDKLNEEIATLRALRADNVGIEIPGIGRVKLRPILFHQQYNLVAQVEKSFPAWMSGKGFSDEIVREALPHLVALAQERRQALQAEFSQASLNDQKKILKKIRYLDLALQKLQGGGITRREKAFYLALLCRMMHVPFVIHCKSSKDRTGGLGKFVAAAYIWVDAGMPDDFTRLIGKNSKKDDPLRLLFDELVTGNLMAAHQVTGCGLGATGVVEGEQLDSERRGLDIGAAPPIVDRLPARYKTDRHPLFIAFWYAIAAPILWILTVVVELIAIAAMLGELFFSTLCPIIPAILRLVSRWNPEAEKYYFYLTKNIGPTMLIDLFIRPLYLFRYPKKVLDKKSAYVTGHELPKPGEHAAQMSNKNAATLRTIELLSDADYAAILTYLRQDDPKLEAGTPHRDTLIALGRAMPQLVQIAKRKNFTLTQKARDLIEAFEASAKTVWDELEFLPETEFNHLCSFMQDEDAPSEAFLSPREQSVLRRIFHWDLDKAPETERAERFVDLLRNSPEGQLLLQGVDSLAPAIYDPIKAFLETPAPDLSTLTALQQRCLLLILKRLPNIQERAQRAAPSPRVVELAALGTHEKVASVLLQQIDLLSEYDYRRLIDFLEKRKYDLPMAPQTLFELLQTNIDAVSSFKPAVLSPRQIAVLGRTARMPKSADDFSLAHIELLEDAQYQRLVDHFQDPDQSPLSEEDQSLLALAVNSTDECFSAGLHANLSDKQRAFLQALAMSPYGTFTYDRTLFFTKTPADLYKWTLVALIRDIDKIKYEAAKKDVPADHFLAHATPYIIVDFIYKWIDEMPKKEYQQLLRLLAQPNPNPRQFTDKQKQLLLAIANHIDILEDPENHLSAAERGDLVRERTSGRYAPLFQACRASHLLLFQVQEIMDPANLNATAARLAAPETLSDWAYYLPRNAPLQSLDGARTYVLAEDTRRDLLRSLNIDFCQGDDQEPIANAGHNEFIFSPEFFATPRGQQFLDRVWEHLTAKEAQDLYNQLALALQTVPLNTLSILLADPKKLPQHGLQGLAESLEAAKAKISIGELSDFLKELQQRLMVDLLFDGVRHLPAFQNIEQFPPALEDCIKQSGRNYLTGKLLMEHLLPSLASMPMEFQAAPGDRWKISFSSADANSFTARFEVDFEFYIVDGGKRVLGHMLLAVEHHFQKPAGSDIWVSRLDIPQAQKIVFSPLCATARDTLFSTFTCPDSAKAPANQYTVQRIKSAISVTMGFIYKLPPDLFAYYDRRIQENLAIAQGIMAADAYAEYTAEVRQERIDAINGLITKLEGRFGELSLDLLNGSEADLNRLLQLLEALIPKEAFDPIALRARNALQQRRDALAAAAAI